MSLSWPQYTNEPPGDGRSCSATLDSYDERHDDVYYVVTLSDAGQTVATFMAAVSALLSTNQSVEEEARTTLRSRIAQIAATGQNEHDVSWSRHAHVTAR